MTVPIIVNVSAFDNALDATGMWEINRDEMAAWYAAAIRYKSGGEDWQALNRAIVARWSESALVYIKRKAWKLVSA